MSIRELSSKMENVYQPHEAVIKRIVEENSSIKTYFLEFTDSELNREFTYLPGQFVMLSVPGQGEAPISIASTPTRPGNLHLSVRRAGRLTSALHLMKEGEHVGIRGPYGRPFPVEEIKGRDLLFVAGGIGLAPLRSLIWYCLDSTGEFGAVTLLYGSRTPSDMAFRADLDSWTSEGAVDVRLTVDEPEDGWNGNVGLVTALLDHVNMDASRVSALLCGPPVMIDAVVSILQEKGLEPGNIITTLERNMKCGVGLCGHCHMHGVLICRQGPVFNVAELSNLQGVSP